MCSNVPNIAMIIPINDIAMPMKCVDVYLYLLMRHKVRRKDHTALEKFIIYGYSKRIIVNTYTLMKLAWLSMKVRRM
jgi:hypothetical protein